MVDDPLGPVFAAQLSIAIGVLDLDMVVFEVDLHERRVEGPAAEVVDEDVSLLV